MRISDWSSDVCSSDLHPKVRRWLDRHTRFVFHFVPTSCSWLNAVEGFFAKLSKRRLKRGIFRSLVDLQAAINRFVAEHNTDPKPFTRSEEHTSELQSLMRISYAVFCLKKKNNTKTNIKNNI